MTFVDQMLHLNVVATFSELHHQIILVYMQVPPSLLKYPGGNGGLNPLFGPQQVAVLKQLSQFSQLSQLNPISQLQVK